MKFFKVHRKFDETDVSGVGHVIDGVIFNDGTVVIKWLTDRSSIAIYSCYEDFKAIHIDSHPLNETVVEMIEVGSVVWVPRGFFSTSKIKEDDVQMIMVKNDE